MTEHATSKRASPKHAITPPKGRPTRARRSYTARRRAFGATAQWVVAGSLFAVALIALFVFVD